MQTQNYITLPDKRKIAYAEYGAPDGIPVFHFHGGYSSRLEPLLLGDDVFKDYSLRIIAPDRPGMGRSSFQPKWEFSDYVTDIEFLADTLNIDKFSVMGISGGGGYVAACAAIIPDRIHSAAVISGAWCMDSHQAMDNLPFKNKVNWFITKKIPFLLPLTHKILLKSFDGTYEEIRKRLEPIIPQPDYEALAEDRRLEIFIKMVKEAFLKGYAGASWDVRLYVRKWDFEIKDIQIPLALFHGKKDQNVPLEKLNVQQK